MSKFNLNLNLNSRLPDARPSSPISWFEYTSRALVFQFPETRPYSDYLVQRLAALLLERLPADSSDRIIKLLPAGFQRSHLLPLLASGKSKPDTSIGYVDFVNRMASTLGCSDLDLPNFKLDSDSALLDYSEKLTDAFLWAIAQNFPADLKRQLKETLPAELRSRMDLYYAEAEEPRAA